MDLQKQDGSQSATPTLDPEHFINPKWASSPVGYEGLMQKLRLLPPRTSFTSFRNERGLATKKFGYSEGKMTKASHIQVWEGTATRVVEYGVRGVRNVLHTLETNTCLLWGVPSFEGDEFKVKTSSKRRGSEIARSREYFKYSDDAAGVLMLDFDAPDGQDFDVDLTIEKLFEAVPEMRKFAYVVNLSCSALIHHPDHGQLKGIGGFRMYFITTLASDIPAIGELLAQKLWLAGHGYIKVGNAGQLLERTLIDTSVWQPERCDFAARGVYADDLTSKAPKAVAVDYDKSSGEPLAPALALRDLKPLTSAQTQTLLVIIEKAKELAWHKASEAKDAWASARSADFAEKKQITRSQAHVLLLATLDKGRLPPEFELRSQDGSVVTVAGLLKNKTQWHKKRFLDPVEPEHRGGNDFCAQALLDGPVPTIHSLAHGKTRYTLETTRVQLFLTGSGRVADRELAVSALESTGYIVRNQVGRLCLVEGKKLIPFPDNGKGLRLECMGVIDTLRIENGKEKLTDYPIGHAQDILEYLREDEFPHVVAVVDHPMIRPDGTLLNALGFDKSTGLYVTETEKTGVVHIQC